MLELDFLRAGRFGLSYGRKEYLSSSDPTNELTDGAGAFLAGEGGFDDVGAAAAGLAAEPGEAA